MSTEIPTKALTAESAPTPEKVLETEPFLAQMLRNKALQDAVESAEAAPRVRIGRSWTASANWERHRARLKKKRHAAKKAARHARRAQRRA